MRKETVLFLLLLICSNVKAQNILVTNVNIISMKDSTISLKKSVLVLDGKIASIKDVITDDLRNKAVVVDAGGAYMIPGLFDMHMHFYHDMGFDKKYLSEEVKMPLANGVTTVRIMNGMPEYLELKKNIASGKFPGPEMFVASPQFVGKWPFREPLEGKMVTNANEAEDAVKEYKTKGYDAIKLTEFVSAEAYDAVIKTAGELNIKVTGHVGPYVKLDKALAAHQQIEHFDEFIETLLPDTSINHGRSVSDYGIWDRKKAWPTVEFVDESKVDELAQKVKRANIYVTATNYFFTKYFGIGATKDEIEHFACYNYVPAFMKKRGDEAFRYYWDNPPSEELRKKYVRLRYAFATSLYHAGVKLMTGSDGPEWYLAPGFTVHDEIETYVKAGLSNFAALQTATINPATYLGIDKRKGTIEAGKEADFVLLEKNPLEDIKNTRTIRAVYTHHQLYNRAELDKLLNEIKAISQSDGKTDQ
jgi:imidazolonepropionase-like amidohydrolase